MDMMSILEDKQIANLVDTCLEKVAPALGRVSLPVDEQGQIDPRILIQLVAQTMVGQRIQGAKLELEMVKVNALLSYLTEHPYNPDTDVQEAWKERLCKHLHSQVIKTADEILAVLEEQRKKQQSKIITPTINGGKPRIIRP